MKPLLFPIALLAGALFVAPVARAQAPASPAAPERNAGFDDVLERLKLDESPSAPPKASVFLPSNGLVSMIYVVSLDEAKGKRIVAPSTIYAKEISDLNEQLEQKPGDGVLLSRRAMHWALIDKMFEKHGGIATGYAARYLPAATPPLQQMIADINAASLADPKNPRVWQNIVMALQLAQARDLRENLAFAAISPEAAQNLERTQTRYASSIDGALQSGVALGDASLVGLKCWVLLRRIAASPEAKRPPLIAELIAASKLAPDDVMAALCVGAALSQLAERPEVRQAVAPAVKSRIDELALAKPQETHDALSRIARILNLSSSDAARQWQTRAAAIPGVQISPDNALLAYTFKAQKSNAELERFVFALDPYFELSLGGSERLRLLEGLARDKAKAGDFASAFKARGFAAHIGGKPDNWIEAGDMAYRAGDFKHAAVYWQMFSTDVGLCINDQPVGLEVYFARVLGGIDTASSFIEGTVFEYEAPYEKQIWAYPPESLAAHAKLLEARLGKIKSLEKDDTFMPRSQEQIRLTVVLGEIKKRLAGEKPATEVTQIRPLLPGSSITNDPEHFRQYAPTKP